MFVLVVLICATLCVCTGVFYYTEITFNAGAMSEMTDFGLPYLTLITYKCDITFVEKLMIVKHTDCKTTYINAKTVHLQVIRLILDIG